MRRNISAGRAKLHVREISAFEFLLLCAEDAAVGLVAERRGEKLRQFAMQTDANSIARLVTQKGGSVELVRVYPDEAIENGNLRANMGPGLGFTQRQVFAFPAVCEALVCSPLSTGQAVFHQVGWSAVVPAKASLHARILGSLPLLFVPPTYRPLLRRHRVSYYTTGGLGSYFTTGRGMSGLGADSCPDGQVLDIASGQCIAAQTGCGTGFHLDAASGLCVLDSAGAGGGGGGDVKQPYNTSAAKAPVKCKPGLVNDASGRYCIQPPGAKQPATGCPANSFSIGADCYTCPDDSTWDGAQGCNCLPGTVYSDAVGGCVPQGLPAGGGVPSGLPGLPGIFGGPAVAPGACPPGQKPDPFTGAFCVPDPSAAGSGVPAPPPPCPAGQVLSSSGCVMAGQPAPVVPLPVPVPSPSTPLLSSPLFWVSLGLLGLGAIVVLTSKPAPAY